MLARVPAEKGLELEGWKEASPGAKEEVLETRLQRLVSPSNSPERKKRGKKYLARISVSVWNSIPLSVKNLNISRFCEKNN